jgi:hypothetical protein
MNRKKLSTDLAKLKTLINSAEDQRFRAEALRILDNLCESDTKPSSPFLYWIFQPLALVVKIALQMAIAVVAVVLLWRLAIPDIAGFQLPNEQVTLELIGEALALAAAIELAYTLFTDGPDEAVDPLMLGLAAFMLFRLANVRNLTSVEAGAFVLYATALGGLFFIRRRFIPNGPDHENWLHKAGIWAWTKIKKSD